MADIHSTWSAAAVFTGSGLFCEQYYVSQPLSHNAVTRAKENHCLSHQTPQIKVLLMWFPEIDLTDDRSNHHVGLFRGDSEDAG